MALYYDLPVFKDTYSLTLKLFELTQNFPREYKFTLGQDMKRDCLQLVRSIYRANKCKNKEIYLEHFLDDFEVLKLEVRLCRDFHLVSIKQQSALAVVMVWIVLENRLPDGEILSVSDMSESVWLRLCGAYKVFV